MPYSITPIGLETFLRDLFNSRYPDFVRADNLTGGGGYENWALVTFLLYLHYRYGDFDYQREFTVTGTGRSQTRADLVFNQHSVTPSTPFIITEWKCNPNHNALSTGCTQDVQKFVDVLNFYGPQRIYPLPLVIGVGPEGTPPYQGFVTYGFGDGLALYMSSSRTWSSVGVLEYTWYAHQPSYDPATPDATSPERLTVPHHPSAARTPTPRRGEADLSEPV